MPRTKTKTKKSAADVLLNSIKSKGSTKSKSATPIVNVTDEDELKKIQAIIDAKRAAKAAEAAKKVAEAAFREAAVEYHEESCRKDSTFHSSVKLAGKVDDETVSLSFIQNKKCGKMLKEEAEDPLRTIFQDDFDELFSIKQTLEIDPSVLSDDQIAELLTAMVKILGESFQDAVSSDPVVIPNESFYGKRIMDDRIRTLAARAVEAGYAKPVSYFK